MQVPRLLVIGAVVVTLGACGLRRVDYECDDNNGDVVDTGTVDVTRRR